MVVALNNLFSLCDLHLIDFILKSLFLSARLVWIPYQLLESAATSLSFLNGGKTDKLMNKSKHNSTLKEDGGGRGEREVCTK